MSVRRAAPERAVQKSLVKYFRLVLPAGSLVASIRNEEAPRSSNPSARARFHASRKATGMLPGMPDLALLLPEGHTIFCEVKAPTNGVISDAQDAIHTRLRSMGYCVFLATSIESARLALTDLGIPLAEAPGQLVAPPTVRRVAKPRKRLPADVVPTW